MFREKTFYIILILFFLNPDFSPGLKGEERSPVNFGNLFLAADSLYQSGQFRRAYKEYRNLPLTSNPATRFKIAYAAFKSGRFEQSAALFDYLSNKQHFLRPYSNYFFIRSLWKIKPSAASDLTDTFIKAHPKHPLTDSLLTTIADYLFALKQFEKAAYFYNRAAKNLPASKQKIYAALQSAEAFYLSGQASKANRKILYSLKKYTKDKQTLQMLSWVRKTKPAFLKEHFFAVTNFYIKIRRYYKAKVLLEKFILSSSTPAQKEKARFMLLEDWYYLGNYRTALYGLKKFTTTNKDLQPQVQLYIARCYRKLGLRKKAIQTYLSLAERFPREKKSCEAFWKAAWMYERGNNLPKAMALYHQLYQRWPNNTFAAEARFREGFAYFRQKLFAKADTVFNEISSKAHKDFDKNRAQYWSALCLERLGHKKEAESRQRELAANLWDNYYTMRSYLLHKSELDTTLPAIQDFRRNPNPLLFYANSLTHLLPDFENALQVQELLGSQYGQIVLDSLKFSLHSLQEWIALAEIYKKFHLYAKAYKTYDFINRRYFNDLSYVEKAFMLKERFPLYYDGLAQSYSKRYALEKELVLAIVKRESAFDPLAHSQADAYGLMQLIPPTAKDMARLAGVKYNGPQQLFNIDLNIHLGTLYLKQLQRHFNGRKACMLAAYNAGPHRVERWLKKSGSYQIDLFVENIEFQETRNYVRYVLKNYWAYKILDSNFTADAAELLGLNVN